MFKQRKNKKFNFTQRHQKKVESDNDGSLGSKWQKSRIPYQRKKGVFTSLPFLIFLLIFVLVVLYFLSRY